MFKPILVGLSLALTGTSSFARDDTTFDTLANVQAVKMTSEEAASVRGMNHVIRLVLLKTGKEEMPNLTAAGALDRAGSTGGVGNDRPAIVGILSR